MYFINSQNFSTIIFSFIVLFPLSLVFFLELILEVCWTFNPPQTKFLDIFNIQVISSVRLFSVLIFSLKMKENVCYMLFQISIEVVNLITIHLISSFLKKILPILISQGCHYKYHRLGDLNNQIFTQFWTLEVQEQSASRTGLF